MDILPVVKLMEQDLKPLEAELEDESGDEVERVEAPEEEEKETVLPQVVSEKAIIPEEDIFVEKKKIKPVKERKKRGPMSEEHKAKLYAAREKAVAVRKANALERKEIRDLVEKKKKKDIQKLRDEVSDDPKPIPRSELPPSLRDIDPELIRKLQEEAIEGYDTKRKARKVLKKREQETNARNQKNMNVINNAIQAPQYGEAGFFNHLF